VADYFQHVCSSNLLLTRFVKLPGEHCNSRFGIRAARLARAARR
jgi:hypothetical protein